MVFKRRTNWMQRHVAENYLHTRKQTLMVSDDNVCFGDTLNFIDE